MNKKALTLSVASILMCSVPTMPVKAISNKNVTTVSDTNQIQTAGLISKYYISVSSGIKTLYINGETEASGNMKSIGYKDIVVEYSNDNSHWYVENDDIKDLLISNSSSYYLNDYSIPVIGGYYYRVKLKHYAKESGWFGSSQSVENTSNSVWVN